MDEALAAWLERAIPSLPRSSVGAVLGRSSVQKTTTTLERRNGIPTLERGNETETNVFTHDPVTVFDLTERVENRFHVSK
ncbi:MAG: hypothetical protein Q8M09_02745 [Pseudomonadota bacterium]|nr:hypothetical protein [Pseudomonadota bacterium]MDP1572999.1 hypothetical protein [Pseudomonadota bacterium]MDP1903157.1 hypothetical protein [Pseudomonadota bacterium]